MTPMIAFIERVRSRIAIVLAQMGASVSFERIRLESIEERASKYTLLRLMRDDGVLDVPQFKAEATALLG